MPAPPCGHRYDAPPIAGCAYCRVRDVPFHKARWADWEPERRCAHLGLPTGGDHIRLNCTLDPPSRVPLFACAVHTLCTQDLVAVGTQCCRYCGQKELPPAPAGEVTIVHGANGIGDGLLGLT